MCVRTFQIYDIQNVITYPVCRLPLGFSQAEVSENKLKKDNYIYLVAYDWQTIVRIYIILTIIVSR